MEKWWGYAPFIPIAETELKTMMKKQKLELTWMGKEKRPKLEARILLEDTEKSYHAQVRPDQSGWSSGDRPA